MLSMKKIMILRSISQLLLMGSPLNLRKKLRTSVKLGLNLTGTLFSKLWCLKDPCSSFSYRSSDSSEIQASERQAPISAETNRPTWRPTPSYVSRSVLNLTRPSTISDALRSRGAFSPSKGKVITSISPVTSGLQVQILCTHEAKLKV